MTMLIVDSSTALEPCHHSVACAAMALEVLEQELKSAIIDIVASDTVRARRVQQQLVGFPRCTAKDSMHVNSSETIQGPELKSVITSKQFTVHIADFVQCVAGKYASCSCSVTVMTIINSNLVHMCYFSRDCHLSVVVLSPVGDVESKCTSQKGPHRHLRGLRWTLTMWCPDQMH